jgi:arginine decarboxylase
MTQNWLIKLRRFDEAEVDVPNIFTEFGSFTVGESGGAISNLVPKKTNDREKWNMIDLFFITTLPDTGLLITFIMLKEPPERNI